MGWWIGSARAGHEFEVRDAIVAFGATAWVAREFATVRPPTKRRHVAVVRPVRGIGRHVVIKCTDDQWHELQDVKHLAATLMPVAAAWCERAEDDVKLRDGHYVPKGKHDREWVPGEVWVRKGEWLRPDGLGAFMERIDADYADREARFAAGETLAAYAPGDLLQILAGPLAEQIVRFERVVTGATDLEDKLRARLEVMGGPVAVTLDPLHVRKIAAE